MLDVRYIWCISYWCVKTYYTKRTDYIPSWIESENFELKTQITLCWATTVTKSYIVCRILRENIFFFKCSIFFFNWAKYSIHIRSHRIYETSKASNRRVEWFFPSFIYRKNYMLSLVCALLWVFYIILSSVSYGICICIWYDENVLL